MAFVGGGHNDFEDHENHNFVSLIPNFGRSSKRLREHLPPVADVASERHQNQGDVYIVEDSTVSILSWFSIFNTLTDVVALIILFASKSSTEGSMISFGLVVASILRAGAVTQYRSKLNILSFASNVFLGSRFGWSEKFDVELLKRASVGVQFGFPLVLHAVADITQQSLSFYPLMVTVTGGFDTFNTAQSLALGVSFACSLFGLLGTILIRLSYGGGLVELGLLTAYSSSFLIFVLLSVFYGEFLEDKVYINDLFFPWFRFLVVVTAAYTKTAVEVRKQKRIILPTSIASILFCLIIIDGVALILVRSDSDTFLEDEQDILDDEIIVDQLIYSNLAFDVYVAMFIGTQYLLLSRGQVL